MGVLKMKEQDMLELYQLCRVYHLTYESKGDEPAGMLLRELEKRYGEDTGAEISKAGNPRNAGRKKKYTEDTNKKIRKLYDDGLSQRTIAKETGCSLGHVQDIVKKAK